MKTSKRKKETQRTKDEFQKTEEKLHRADSWLWSFVFCLLPFSSFLLPVDLLSEGEPLQKLDTVGDEHCFPKAST